MLTVTLHLSTANDQGKNACKNLLVLNDIFSKQDSHCVYIFRLLTSK